MPLAMQQAGAGVWVATDMHGHCMQQEDLCPAVHRMWRRSLHSGASNAALSRYPLHYWQRMSDPFSSPVHLAACARKVPTDHLH